MAEPSDKIIKRLFALSGNVCAYPGCTLPIVESAGTVTGETYHIKARKAGGPRFDLGQSEDARQAVANLILLCRHHHKVVDSGPELYSVDALLKIKSIHENVAGRPARATDAFFAKIFLNDPKRITVTNNTGNVAINSPGATQALTVTFKTGRRSVLVNAPPGTIGTDQQLSRYVQYLIK